MMPVNRILYWSLGVILLALVVAITLPLFVNGYGLAFATTLLEWIALAESWVILSGYTGYVSLGHAAFVGTGAYVLTLTWGMVPFPVGLALAGVASSLLAFIIGAPCLRVRGPYFVILTLGVAEFLKFAVIKVEASLGMFGRLLLDAPEPLVMFHAAAGLAAAAILLALVVRYTKFGVGLRAIRENEAAAEMTGVNLALLKIIAFVLSALIPGLIGGIMVARNGYFEPLQIFSPRISLTIITICIAGGSDNPWGPVIGALFLNVLSEFLSDRAPQLYMIILGLILVVFVLKLPEGIYGWAAKVLSKLPRSGWRRQKRVAL
jgi:branched-chain amino acid transport system permease protein